MGGPDRYENDTRVFASSKHRLTISTLADLRDFTATNLTRRQAAYLGWLLTEWVRTGVIPTVGGDSGNA